MLGELPTIVFSPKGELYADPSFLILPFIAVSPEQYWTGLQQ